MSSGRGVVNINDDIELYSSSSELVGHITVPSGVDANGPDIEGVYQFNVPVDYPITFNYYSEDDATGNMIDVNSYDTKVTENSIDYYSGIVIIKVDSGWNNSSFKSNGLNNGDIFDDISGLNKLFLT